MCHCLHANLLKADAELLRMHTVMQRDSGGFTIQQDECPAEMDTVQDVAVISGPSHFSIMQGWIAGLINCWPLHHGDCSAATSS